MAKAGRPKSEEPRDHIVTFRLKDEDYLQLREFAENYNMTMTQVIEEAVKEHIEKQQTN